MLLCSLITYFFPISIQVLGEVGGVLRWGNWEEFNKDALYKGVNRAGRNQKGWCSIPRAKEKQEGIKLIIFLLIHYLIFFGQQISLEPLVGAQKIISKESTCNAGDLGSIPGLGRSPGNPLHHSCLENPHGQRSLVGYSPWSGKESDVTDRLSTQRIIEEMIHKHL